MNATNNVELEEKITCGKIKSRAKTLLTCQIKKINFLNENNLEHIIIPSIKINKIIIECANSNNFDLVSYYIQNSLIIISNEPNPKGNNQNKLLILPGHLASVEIKKTETCKMELDINFANFFPHNIQANISDMYFMIWFKTIIPEGLIKKIILSYDTLKTTIDKSNLINNEMITIQQTQTFKSCCKNKHQDVVKKKVDFDNMCRAFWYKMNSNDFNNLDELVIRLNGIDRIKLSKKQIELVCKKKNLCDNYILIFLNLELGNDDWFLPQELNQIKQIGSNTINGSRIDEFCCIFKFTNKFTYGDIQITSLSLNNVLLNNNILLWNIF